MIALATLPILLLAAAPLRVGVVAVGLDDAATATLQASVESKVGSSPERVLRRASDLALLLGLVRDPAGTWSDPAVRTKAEALIAAIGEAYYEARMPDAVARLAEANAFVAKQSDAPVETRAHLLLWGAGIKLKQAGDAAADVRIALLLAPGLKIPEDLPPPVQQLVKKLPPSKLFRLQLSGVPAGSMVRLDDAAVLGTSFRTGEGPHKIVVVVPGLRPWTQVVEVSADATLALSPSALALPPASASELLAAARKSELSASDRSALAALASKDKLDALVLVAADGSAARALVFWRDGRVRSAPPAPLDETEPLTRWIVEQLGSNPALAIAKPTPKPAVGGAGGGFGTRRMAGVGVLALSAWAAGFGGNELAMRGESLQNQKKASGSARDAYDPEIRRYQNNALGSFALAAVGTGVGAWLLLGGKSHPASAHVEVTPSSAFVTFETRFGGP